MRISDLPKWAQDALEKGCSCRQGAWGSVVPPRPCKYCRAVQLWRDLGGAPRQPAPMPRTEPDPDLNETGTPFVKDDPVENFFDSFRPGFQKTSPRPRPRNTHQYYGDGFNTFFTYRAPKGSPRDCHCNPENGGSGVCGCAHWSTTYC